MNISLQDAISHTVSFNNVIMTTYFTDDVRVT